MRKNSFSKFLAIGTAQIGSKYGINNKNKNFTLKEIKKILNFSRMNGIDTIDTATSYGNAEKKIGQINPKGFKVVSKISFKGKKKLNSELIESEIEKSAKKLKINSHYAILLHNEKDLVGDGSEIIYNSLQKLKKNGLIKNIGVSVYNCKNLGKILSRFKLDIVQLPYNIIDQNFETSGWIKKLKKMNIKIHVRSIFLQGLLLLNYNNIPKKFLKYKKLFKKLDQEITSNKISRVEACLNFVLNKKKYFDKIVVGLDNFSHLKEILRTKPDLSLHEKFKKFASNQKELINPALWKK